MYDENRKFTKLVMFMAEKYYSNNLELNEAVSTFEDAVETSGNGEASFGVAGEDWERIEITAPPRISTAMLGSTQNTIMDSKHHSWSVSGTKIMLS